MTCLQGAAQDFALKNVDHVYVENIKTVNFHVDGDLLSYPIIELNSNARLLLSFDDFNEDITDYIYTVTLCNADWTPADLNEMDYINGFNGDRITNYEFSFNTLKGYTHFELQLPNNNLRLLVSGNYLLQVFEEYGDQRPVITRRFMVVEPLMKTLPQMVAPAMVSKNRTHQEIDFTVSHKGMEVRNARKEVSATVLQNGRWDNAIMDIKPLYIKGYDLIFDHQDKVVFPAGKEFRFLDIRSFRYLSENVAEITRSGDTYDVLMRKDEPRVFRNFQAFTDINGNFVIENADGRNPHLGGDYASVLISMGVTQEYFDSEVYLMGKMTDWQLKPEFKMIYNPAVSAYVARVLLKQGYYNYYFVELPEGSPAYSHENIEGDWYETENKYTILVYYRPFGERHDLLVSAVTITSNY